MATGYSGVAIYTRSSVCAPIRAEEGITGILRPPKSSTSFFELPEEQQIGGYPSISQYGDMPFDAAAIDAEGRCVILEFPAFVLIGTYCPADSSGTKSDFRIGFLNLLDARIRNLTAMGKRVILAGDINIMRDEIDCALLDERLRKEGMTVEEFFSRPARRLFNHLLEGGKIYGERDKGLEKPVLVDICREFFPDRKGMYTHWETKRNYRPANFGSRIDYICVSPEIKSWFSEANIQEGLQGSDHCPVFALLKDKVMLHGVEMDISDIMNPPGMFQGGLRKQEWTVKNLLPTSAKKMPDFDKRRSIKDMFMKPALSKRQSSTVSHRGSEGPGKSVDREAASAENVTQAPPSPLTPSSMKEAGSKATSQALSPTLNNTPAKRPASSQPLYRPTKKIKAAASKAAKNAPAKGQTSLAGFFKPKRASPVAEDTPKMSLSNSGTEKDQQSKSTNDITSLNGTRDTKTTSAPSTPSKEICATFNLADQPDVVDPIVAKESWDKLLRKRAVPRCEHGEPCISLLTKKPGVNCGRSFYICPRPLGPTGEKEKNSEWRCGTFIWSSDWKGEKAETAGG